MRSLIFAAIIAIAIFYIGIYLLFSAPPFQAYVKEVVEKELSSFLGSKVEIRSLILKPFNEAVVEGLNVQTPEGANCLYIEKVGAGINLTKLIIDREIEITYGEIIGMNADLRQSEEGAPWNIQFIIDAFSPQSPKKEKTKFDLKLHNIVLRKCDLTVNKDWAPRIGNNNKLDFNHFKIKDLRSDIVFPRLSDEEINVDVRRLSFYLGENKNLSVDKIAFKSIFTPETLLVENLLIQLPNSLIRPSDIDITYQSPDKIIESFATGNHKIILEDNYITPSDLSYLEPFLADFNRPVKLTVSLVGNTNNLNIPILYIDVPDIGSLDLDAQLDNLSNPEKLTFNSNRFNISVRKEAYTKILPLIKGIPAETLDLISNLGEFIATGSIAGNLGSREYGVDVELIGNIFDIQINGNLRNETKDRFYIDSELEINKLDLSEIINKIEIADLKGNINFSGEVANNNIDGDLKTNISSLIYRGIEIGNLDLSASKENNDIKAEFLMDNDLGFAQFSLDGMISKEFSNIELETTFRDLNPSKILNLNQLNNYSFEGDVSLALSGSNIDDITGVIDVSDFNIFDGSQKKKFGLNHLDILSTLSDGQRNINLKSDWINGEIKGDFNIKDVISETTAMVNGIIPSLVPYPTFEPKKESSLDFNFTIDEDIVNNEFFKVPVKPLVPITITGFLNGKEKVADINIEAPYLLQGKDKLVSDSRVKINLNGQNSLLTGYITSTFPVKKGELTLNVDITGHNDNISTDISWLNIDNHDFNGKVGLNTFISKNELTRKPEIELTISPSLLSMGDADWNIDNSRIKYADRVISVNDLKIWHKDQFVEINGKASENFNDIIRVKLADIDVDYIFDTLKINYVTFGGRATGEVDGRALLSTEPVAETKHLEIKNLSYNGAIIGDCLATSSWNHSEKKVEIGADITYNNKRRVLASGGVWVTRDSLAFDFNADKVPVEFIQPFMQVFSSDVGGFASGQVKLFGSFKDIDMTGKIFADSISMKLDYTNTYYHGSDSIYLYPGRIEIPGFKLYDRYGNSGIFSGELIHKYFHDPSFTFRLSNAQNLMCYDTSSSLNPDWYGTLFGSGSALIRGLPGWVDISADMSIVGNSSFTFVLNETQYADDYQFLTFSDKRKEARLKERMDTVDDIKARFKKKITEENISHSKFGIDIRASVTPSVLFTVIMDPAAGDRISGRGSGPIQIKYESDNDEMKMYGKYTIDQGNYNFSLQDIILRDFKILPGSSISFNGDPLGATLDISASYRVNTNLSDLDKSFSTDRDLARTNVPVDAILKVDGPMQQPDITFDIVLPTLTQDVERKVKSIISTDDMMNRQIIYLLALNRFYTPEYMGSTSNGGELAAVASSTISSQLSNMLGQLTDKVTVSPSFRSDKGDFSDMEVDVALSSRLLNNRLLINGNFGYRDKSTSSTTFIGDFDIEYLLNKNGNLRLKAYNHFNDQNYYLRQALTTQGLGVIYRKDFDSFINLFRRKKRENPEETIENTSDQLQEN